MTRRPEPDPRAKGSSDWLSPYQHALSGALDGLLDVEAGLRDMLLQSRHDTVIGRLDTVLDTEAGLAAILPPPPPTHLTGPRITSHGDTGEELPRTISPADRMALRNHPDVKTANYARQQIRCLRGGSLPAARDLFLILAHHFVAGINRDLSRARDLTRNPVLIGLLDRTRRHADDLDLDLGLARTSSLDLDRSLARVLSLARRVDGDRASAADLSRARARARDLGRLLNLSLTTDLPPDPDYAVGPALELIVSVLGEEIHRAIGLALGREIPTLDADVLQALLDDFTSADLTDADLSGVDLGGVHWTSHGTRWPPAIDVGDLKNRSDEAFPGSETWIIRSGTAPVRDLADR
ncbi:hypothetical protein [Streptomyces canus]|uniref:hypothetical protein n=1 Tax=Streptomyces canus TaxID=58343 RepID=UPI0036E79C2C